jgi:hypothetical protein
MKPTLSLFLSHEADRLSPSLLDTHTISVSVCLCLSSMPTRYRERESGAREGGGEGRREGARETE